MSVSPATAEHPFSGSLPLTPGQRLRRLLRLQGFYAFLAAMHWTLAFFFLVREREFSITQVLLVAFIVYLAGAILILVLPAIEARWALRIGFLLRILVIVPYWLFPQFPAILAASALFGFALVLFWVPYNLIFFEHRARTTNAGVSAVYAAVQPALDVVAALLAGYLVMRWGFPALFASAFFIGVIAWPATFRLRPRAAIPMDLWGRMARLRRLRTLIVMDGVAQGVVWPAVPIVTLTVIAGAFAYAGFFAALAVAGAVGAIIMGRISDKRAKRFAFIWPVAFVLAAANAFSIFAVASVAVWGVLRGLATMSGILLDPFRNAVLLDNASTVEDLFIAREFLLNMGRMAGVTSVFLVHLMWSIEYVFLIPAVLSLAVPFVIIARDLYPEERVIFKPLRSMFRQ
jgi:hypothetical protein